MDSVDIPQAALPALQELSPTEQINPASMGIDAMDTLTMLQTINQQDQSVALAVQQALPQITPVVDAVTEALLQGGRLLYFGAGTSGRLGVLDASECPPTFGVPADWVQGFIAGGDVALRHAVEGAEDSFEGGYEQALAQQLSERDVVLALSASGGAPYVLGVIAAAKEARVSLTAGLTCVAGSPLAKAAQQPIVVSVGPEVITGSTRLKAGTAQKLVLNMISTASMVKIGKTYGNLMVDLKASNQKLRARATRLVSTLAQTDEEKALALLEASQWQVKTAVLMGRLALSMDEAQNLLRQHQGRLRLAMQQAT